MILFMNSVFEKSPRIPTILYSKSIFFAHDFSFQHLYHSNYIPPFCGMAPSPAFSTGSIQEGLFLNILMTGYKKI